MNDDLPTSPAADQSPIQNAYPIADADTFRWEDSNPDNVDWHERQRLQNRIQKAKKVELFDDLVRTLDIMIFCELSVLYYMDGSLIRFLLRALVEWVYFTPKPKIFPDPPENRPYIGAIVGTNIICMLFHIFSARPEAGEATRGYLRGGLLIDFVGQKGPVSKTRLVLLDLLTLVLQLLVLAAFVTRQELLSGPTTPNVAAADPSSTLTPPNAQDHDSEERAVLRSDLPHVSDNSIELQPLYRHHHHHQQPSSAGRTCGDEDGERDELLAAHHEAHDTRETTSTTQHHPLDEFHTGGHVIADLRVVATVREQWARYQGRGGSAAASASGTVAVAVAASLRGIGWVFGRFGARAF